MYMYVRNYDIVCWWRSLRKWNRRCDTKEDITFWNMSIVDHIRQWCYASVGAVYIKQNDCIRRCSYWKNLWKAVFAGGTNIISKRSCLSIYQPWKNEYSLSLRTRNSVTRFSQCYIKNCGSISTTNIWLHTLSLFYLLFDQISRPHYLTIRGKNLFRE